MFLLKEDKPTNIKNLFTTLFLFIALSMNINAARVDNIAKVVFFKSNDLPFAAFQEILFHPTTQSYAKGNLVTSGYSESRISIYNLTNGKLIAQKNMGRIDSTEAFILLGYTPDNLWIYSLKYKSGLQSLDPITLERKISQATIYSKLTHTIGSFIMPQWHELKTSYGFSCIQQKLIVTNQQNEQFYIDAETFAPEKITELININPVYNENLKKSVVINDSVWNLDGYKQLKLVHSNMVLNKPTFLFGSFIMEQNPISLFQFYFNQQELYASEQEYLTQVSQPTDKHNEELIIAENKLNTAKKNVSLLIQGNKPDHLLMQYQTNSFFIYSKDEDSDESVIKISKLTTTHDTKIKLDWERKVPGMFYNVASARNSRTFKYFFGDFVPDFNFHHIELIDNKIIIIYLMQVCCINADSGEIEWSFVLK